MQKILIEADRLAYSVAEAAQLISVSQRTLYNYIAGGTLKAIKVGGRRLVRRSDLERLIEGGEMKA